LKQARGHLATLEQQQRADEPQMGLFDQAAFIELDEPQEAGEKDSLRVKIEETDPDSLTPREALALLYELKEM
jgi:DNA mismatch repair protein MutS